MHLSSIPPFLFWSQSVDIVYWLFNVWFVLDACGLAGNAVCCLFFFWLFCDPLGAACLRVTPNTARVKGDVSPCDKQRDDVTHSCQHSLMHFERQLCVGICCSKARMHLQCERHFFFPLHSMISAAVTERACHSCQASLNSIV